MKSGHTRSCGCYQKRITAHNKRKHGHTKNVKATRTYKTWRNMLTRCNNSNAMNYNQYGGRGIKVCQSWSNFKTFLKDMGKRPKGQTIDRIDNNKGYCKGNCRWASINEQQRNRQDTHYAVYKGETLPLLEIYEKVKPDMGYKAFRDRIKAGWPLERALQQPLKVIK